MWIIHDEQVRSTCAKNSEALRQVNAELIVFMQGYAAELALDCLACPPIFSKCRDKRHTMSGSQSTDCIGNERGGASPKQHTFERHAEPLRKQAA